MGLFDHFPYTNFHELNLDWILRMLQEIDKTMDEFVAINALKYADPIQWNINSQYEKNTIVIDPQTGTAYISVAPVPIGVALINTDYWAVVFDLSSFVVRAAQNLANTWEAETTTTATVSTAAGGWIVWGDTLYRALVNITAGDSYVVNGNIEHFTIEDVVGHIENLNTSDKSNLVSAINELLQTINDEITRVDSNTGDPADLNTTDKSNLVSAINEVLQTLVDTTGDTADLDTTDKSNLVAAINEVLQTLTDTCGDLADLNTTDKSNLVAAINEVQDITNNIVDLWEVIDLKPIAQDCNTLIADCFPQGGCVFIRNNVKYILSIMWNENTEQCVWSVYDYDNNTLVYQTTSIPSKHSNSVTYYDGYFYCSRGGDLFVYKVPFDLSTYTTVNIGSDSNYSIYYYDGDFYVSERYGVMEIIDADTLEIKKHIVMDDIVSPDGSASRAFAAIDQNKIYMCWLDYDVAHEMFCQVMNMDGKTISLFKFPTYNEPESITFLDGVLYVSVGCQNCALWCASTAYRDGVYNYDDNYYTLPTYTSSFDVYCDSTITSFKADGSNSYPLKKFYFAYFLYRQRYTHFNIYLTGDFSSQANFNIKKCNAFLQLIGTDQNNGVDVAGVYLLNCSHVELDYINIVKGNGNDNYSITAISSFMVMRHGKIVGNNAVGAIHSENAEIVFGGVDISGDFTTYLFNLSSFSNFNFSSGSISLNTNRTSASRGMLRLFNNFPPTYLTNWDRYSKLDAPIAIDNQNVTITNVNLSGVYALESNCNVTGLPTGVTLPVILEVNHLNNVFEYKLMRESQDTTIYYRKRINANNDSGWLKIEPVSL